MSEAGLLAIHYQNDNCHAQGRVRLALAEADPRREGLIGAARRLFAPPELPACPSCTSATPGSPTTATSR